MNLLLMLASLETADDLHMARLLLLINAFAGPSGVGTIDGLTKLAKLDFLLRYPVFLERALMTKGVSPLRAAVLPHERNSVESSMVRFRYGPWDFRYRRYLNLLVAKSLATVSVEGRTVIIGISPRGREVAQELAGSKIHADTASRARLLKSHFNMGAVQLMRFVYETFPEIGTLRLGEEIEA